MPQATVPQATMPPATTAAPGRTAPRPRARLLGLYAILAAANLGAWAWALVAFRRHPVLLGTALLAYGLGLRHAVDADHIAAIDNVTRKLMHDGRRPHTVGLFFSLGHSSVVVLASLAVAATASASRGRFETIRSVGGVVGTLASASFLLAIAAVNTAVLLAAYRTFRRVRAGEPCRDEDLDRLLAGRGLLARLLRPMFALVRRSWHMVPLGILFGLGFDTATEIALLGISAQASQDLPAWSILVFPALFAAAMSLVDTTDSVLMAGAYGGAFVTPVRRLRTNMAMTLASVLVAALVGGIEALGLAQRQLGLHGPAWRAIAALNDSSGAVGTLVLAVFALSWIVSAAICRARGYDRPETPGR